MLAAGLSVELWAYDHNTDHAEFPAAVLEGSSFVQAVAWHCYSGGWEVLTAFHEQYPNAAQFMTECWTHAEVDSTNTNTTPQKQTNSNALLTREHFCCSQLADCAANARASRFLNFPISCSVRY